MNWRMFVARHLKTIVIAVSIGLFLLSLVAKAHADPIDSPVGPI